MPIFRLSNGKEIAYKVEGGKIEYFEATLKKAEVITAEMVELTLKAEEELKNGMLRSESGLRTGGAE